MFRPVLAAGALFAIVFATRDSSPLPLRESSLAPVVEPEPAPPMETTGTLGAVEPSLPVLTAVHIRQEMAKLIASPPLLQHWDAIMVLVRAAFEGRATQAALEILEGLLEAADEQTTSAIGLTLGFEWLLRSHPPDREEDFQEIALRGATPNLRLLAIEYLRGNYARNAASVKVARSVFRETGSVVLHAAALRLLGEAADNWWDVVDLADQARAVGGDEMRAASIDALGAFIQRKRDCTPILDVIRWYSMSGPVSHRLEVIGALETWADPRYNEPPTCIEDLLRDLAEADPDPDAREAAAKSLRSITAWRRRSHPSMD